MARDIVIGLDIGTSAVKIAAIEIRSSGELHILTTAQKPSSGLRRGYIVDQDAVIESIRKTAKEAERLTNMPIKHAYLAVGGAKLETVRNRGNVIVSRADNEITSTDVKRAVSQAEAGLNKITNKTIIHRIPFAFKVDGEIVTGRPVGIKGEKLEADVLFITCFSQHLEDRVKSAEAAGIAVDDVVAGPFAASFAALTKHQKEVGAILIDIGAETTSMAVFEENNLISLEVFPFGSAHITNDIAIGLQVPLEEAEELKFNYISDNQKRKLGDIIEARLDDIFELIETHLKKIGRNQLLPAGAVLIGGGANLFNIENLAKTNLKLPAKVGNPAIPLKISDKQIYNPKWTTCLGLCVFGSDESLNPDPENPGPRRPPNPILNWLKHFVP